jgi:hypothetical protein
VSIERHSLVCTWAGGLTVRLDHFLVEAMRCHKTLYL